MGPYVVQTEQEGSLSRTASLYWQLIDSLNHQELLSLEVRFDIQIDLSDLNYPFILVHIAIFMPSEATTASKWPQR